MEVKEITIERLSEVTITEQEKEFLFKIQEIIYRLCNESYADDEYAILDDMMQAFRKSNTWDLTDFYRD